MGASRKETRLTALRRGALGDTILFLPVLEAFRRAYPGERLLFVGNGDYLELVSLAGLAEETLPASIWPPLLELFRRGGPPAPPPAELARARQVLLEWERDGRWGPIRLFRTAPEEGRRDPLTLQLLERLDLRDQAHWPPRPLSALRAALGGRQGGGGPVCLHPGAGSPRKSWGAGNFLRLGRLLRDRGIPLRVLLGPVEAERGPGADLFRREGLETEAFRDVRELGRRLAGASLYVGNDSGPGHLAAALGTPCLLLFGPTDPAVWGPPWPGAVCLEGGAHWERLDPEDLARRVEALGIT